ncbi:long-chain fatty acid--CoA ligase [Pseudomaricurvus alkylphenolicus]|uniref:acyl-CoA synthetase n=1 Tax=Pseudomaricurvus alkylphenolicus TaxID=1306991 RepID=UPI00141E3822|nr:long-chain fatty acid--CoA ligase [Pseudomaricurvus alkylphenolicus]NIB38196.1 long-chain fatty acid--CoA ligase [Pseudomaricurvus alkylphenolicus]
MNIGITHSLHRSLQVSPNRAATIFEGRRTSWMELVDRVARMAAALKSLGLNADDRVAYLGQNSDRIVEFYFSAFWSGGVAVPLNYRWSVQENLYALNDSSPRFLFVDDGYIDQADTLTKSPIEKVIYVGDGDCPAGMISSEQLISSHEPIVDARRSGGDIAGIFYTGGTTGFPKGVMISHEAIWINAISNLSEKRTHRESVILHSAPMFHMAAFTSLISGTLVAATHIALKNFSAGDVLHTIGRYRVTQMFFVPTMLQSILEHPEFDRTDTSCIQMLSYGAAAISEKLLRSVIERIPTANLSQSYGQTELGPFATTLSPQDHLLDGRHPERLRSAGQTVAHAEVRVVDASRIERPVGEVGEIMVRGPGVMTGYWKLPEVTEKTLIDGWVMTGDAGYFDQFGYLYIVDRVKDMIVSGGENIYSAEVEKALNKHPNVKEAAVIGIPDDKWGEAVHAIVVVKDGEAVSKDDLIKHCREWIADYKCPKDISFREENLPLTSIGKVSKVELREPFWRDVDRSVN